MSSLLPGSLSTSPFCLATTTDGGELGQMNIFTARWVDTSTRKWTGNAFCVGTIVPALAMVGSTRFTVPNVTAVRNHFGGAWGEGGTSKNVSDDSFVSLTSDCSWGWSSQTGTTTSFVDRNRIAITRLP
jgi:hypothetical protein